MFDTRGRDPPTCGFAVGVDLAWWRSGTENPRVRGSIPFPATISRKVVAVRQRPFLLCK